jgi:hypothetical protein
MKMRWFWSALLLLALVSAGCQSGSPAMTEQPAVEKTVEVQAPSKATEEAPVSPGTSAPATPYPLPTETVETAPTPYPNPQEMLPAGPLYPDIKDGAEVFWEQAVGMIMYGEVSKVVQTHDLKVYLTLKDGRTLVTVEPAIDEVLKMIQMCGEMCKDIKVATE